MILSFLLHPEISTFPSTSRTSARGPRNRPYVTMPPVEPTEGGSPVIIPPANPPETAGAAQAAEAARSWTDPPAEAECDRHSGSNGPVTSSSASADRGGRFSFEGGDTVCRDRTRSKQSAEITADLKGADVYYFVDYRGLTFAEATELRARLRKVDAESQGGQEHPGQDSGGRRGRGGPERVAAGPHGHRLRPWRPGQVAKTIQDFIKEKKKAAIRGGKLQRSLLTATDMEALAALPSREQLIAQVVGAIASPLTGLANVLARSYPRTGGGPRAKYRNRKRTPPSGRRRKKGVEKRLEGVEQGDPAGTYRRDQEDDGAGAVRAGQGA